MATWLYHIYRSEHEPVITINLDDHWFRIPPNEPFEVDSDSNGRKLDNPEFYAHHIIQQYGSIYGIVEIEAQRTRTGIVLDIDKAHEQATAALLINRHRHINAWAQEQLKTRVNKNLPVMAPTGFVADSIKILNIDLDTAYRIRPVGWDFRPTAPTSADPSLLGPPVGADNGEELAALRAEVAEMRRIMTESLAGRSPEPAQSANKPSTTKTVARS